MQIEDRIVRLEEEVSRLRRLLEERDQRTRDAAAFATALLARHLLDRGSIDEESFLSSVSRFRGDPLSPSEHRGQVLGYVREWLHTLQGFDRYFSPGNGTCAMQGASE